jgi:hypothetical protein
MVFYRPPRVGYPANRTLARQAVILSNAEDIFSQKNQRLADNKAFGLLKPTRH